MMGKVRKAINTLTENLLEGKSARVMFFVSDDEDVKRLKSAIQNRLDGVEHTYRMSAARVSELEAENRRLYAALAGEKYAESSKASGTTIGQGMGNASEKEVAVLNAIRDLALSLIPEYDTTEHTYTVTLARGERGDVVMFKNALLIPAKSWTPWATSTAGIENATEKR